MTPIELISIICAVQYLLFSVSLLFVGLHLNSRLKHLSHEKFFYLIAAACITPVVGIVFVIWIDYLIIHGFIKNKKISETRT